MTTSVPTEDSEGRRNRVNDRQLARLGLIAGVLVAVIGVGSSLVTSYYSGRSAASQGQADFQRTQRITAYTAFVDEVSKFELDATEGIYLLTASGYVPANSLPKDKNGQIQIKPPSIAAVNSLVDKIDAQMVAVGTKESVVELIGSKPVRENAQAIVNGLQDLETNFQYVRNKLINPSVNSDTYTDEVVRLFFDSSGTSDASEDQGVGNFYSAVRDELGVHD